MGSEPFPAGQFLGRELVPIAGFSTADHPLADSNNNSGLASGDPRRVVPSPLRMPQDNTRWDVARGESHAF